MSEEERLTRAIQRQVARRVSEEMAVDQFFQLSPEGRVYIKIDLFRPTPCELLRVSDPDLDLNVCRTVSAAYLDFLEDHYSQLGDYGTKEIASRLRGMGREDVGLREVLDATTSETVVKFPGLPDQEQRETLLLIEDYLSL